MKYVWTSLISICLIAGSIWIVLNRQLLLDQVIVWQYQPTEEIEQLAADAKMTDHGRFLFYAAEPRLDGTQAFNEVCKRQEEKSAILGCYASGRIFVYDVPDPRLDGVKEVTAAHEMLHVAYERLSSSERNTIATELEKVYQSVKDQKLQERMEYYARTEPGQQANELHAILATEYDSLTPVLEEHYSRYFTDRQALVALHDQYSGKFTELADTTSDLQVQLESLSTEIASQSSLYGKSIEELNVRIGQFNSRASAGDFADRGQFETERNSLVKEADRLTQQRASINAKVEEYERLRVQYNSLVDESNSMQQALDSSLAPAPSV